MYSCPPLISAVVLLGTVPKSCLTSSFPAMQCWLRLAAWKQQWKSIKSELKIMSELKKNIMSETEAELETIIQQRNKVISELEMLRNKIMSEPEKMTIMPEAEAELEKVKQQRHFEISNIMSELEMVKEQRYSELSNTMADSELEKMKQQRLCVVCVDGQRDTVIKPCSHLCVCSVCAHALSVCPICRRPVKRKEKIFDA